ncbi:MAG: hypothetical protein JSR21_05220 [Proteobacteria bacterium]|nr:hypothetical protein [Pseudomonadota bacterium]
MLAALAPFTRAYAQVADSYTAAGFQPVLTTTVAGPFTGCTKDQTYTFADGSRFICAARRTAFAVNPKATLLQNPDGTVSVLIIDGIAYAGAFTRATGGILTTPIPTSIEEPVPAKASQPTSAVGAIRPVDPITAIMSMRDIAGLRDEAIQEYPPPKFRR